MPARTAAKAVGEFRDTLRAVLSCLTQTVLQVSGYQSTDGAQAATLNHGDPVRLKARDGTSWGLTVKVQYRVMRQDDQYAVQIAAYHYGVTDGGGHELLVYHWHPEQHGRANLAHLHLNSRVLQHPHERLSKWHVPTHRIALEDVIRLLLEETGVTPLRADWDQMLRQTRETIAEPET